jgi:hypothetical protein
MPLGVRRSPRDGRSGSRDRAAGGSGALGHPVQHVRSARVPSAATASTASETAGGAIEPSAGGTHGTRPT